MGGVFTTSDIGTLDISPDGTLVVSGSWDNTGETYEINPQAIPWLVSNARISGGTIRILGPSPLWTHGARFDDGVVIEGDLFVEDIPGSQTPRPEVIFDGGARWTGSITTRGSSVDIRFRESYTLQNQSIVGEVSKPEIEIGAGTTFTVDQNSYIGNVRIDEFRPTPPSPATFINEGIIENFTITTSFVVNRGLFLASGGNGSDASSVGHHSSPVGATFVNEPDGIVRAIDGGRFQLNEVWTNQGRMEALAGGILALGGQFATADIGSVEKDATSTIYVGWEWDNTGGSFTFSQRTGSWILLGGNRNGIIRGGDIYPGPNGESLHIRSGRLTEGAVLHDDVVFVGDGQLKLETGGTFLGDAFLTADRASLYVDGDYSFLGRTFHLDGNNADLFIAQNRTVTLGPNSVVRGRGDIKGAATLLNHGTIRADLPGILVISVSQVTGDGRIEALTGSEIRIDGHILGTGDVIADGGIVRVRAGLDENESHVSGNLIIRNGGQFALEYGTWVARDLIASEGAAIQVSTGFSRPPESPALAISQHFRLGMTNASNWVWASESRLSMLGGIGETVDDFTNWAQLEVSGTDGGDEPANFIQSNFLLPELVIGSDAHVGLVNYFDNGNQNGDLPEAIYVTTLTFEDGLGQLNLNGFHLYFGTLNGDVNQIIDILMLPGDFTGDGMVDGDDFLAWQSGFGRFPGGGATHADGDADRDGDVDGADFLVWQNQYGTEAGSGSHAAAVPEPAAFVLMLAWVLVATCRHPLSDGSI